MALGAATKKAPGEISAGGSYYFPMLQRKLGELHIHTARHCRGFVTR
ncbi:MAG: hypothetical protein QOF62_1983 [Pyrinomonadaceae bacterium]|jgi:hypothetical protein|nr:hypothetical protein [Pyrinomonadaceae bacterium]